MNILILNTHSPLNAGDLAILRETLVYLQQTFPNTTVTVAINDYDCPRDRLPPDAIYVPSLMTWLVHVNAMGEWHWHKPLTIPYAVLLLFTALTFRLTGKRLLPLNSKRRQLITAYYDATLVMVIGGGHLWARHRLNINFFWLWLGLVLAVIMRKPLLLLPQSFGPLPGKLQQRMLYQVLRHSPFIAAREYRSLKFLHQIGVKQRVLVLPDLAFTTAEALPSSVATILSGITQQRANGRLVVGLTVMDWGRQTPNFYHQQRYETAVVALIRHLQINYNAYVVLFSQCCGPTPAEDDRRIARRIAQAVGQSNNLFLVETIVPPEVLKAAYRQMDIVVATRMHSAIFALSVGVPTLVISYLYKAIGMMEMLGLESHVLDINTITADYLCTGFDQLWAKRAAIRYHLSQRLPAIHTTLTQLPRLIRESVIIP